MKLDQNEILSLLFLSTSFEKEINMKEINEFLDIYYIIFFNFAKSF